MKSVLKVLLLTSALTSALFVSGKASAITTEDQIATRNGTTCAIRQSSSNSLYCWGNTDNCQTGASCSGNWSTPFGTMPGVVSKVTMFEGGVCAIKSAGLYCWGRNDYGQGGQAVKPPSTWPEYPRTSATVDGMGSLVSDVSGGLNHVCAVKNGAAYCWGWNNYGQLGDGTTIDRHIPTAVVGLSSGVNKISAGARTTCALMNTGAVKCWGRYHGNSSPAGDVLLPTTVSSLTSGVSSIAGGDFHNCVVHNGTAKCWGINTDGQLGVGTVGSTYPTPQTVPLGSNVVRVYAGLRNTCARVSSGHLYCWGDNDAGQIGNGTLTQSNVPVLITSISATTTVSVGYYNTCSLSTGGFRCWGDGTFGQIDTGSSNPQTTPYLLIGIPN